MVFFQTAGRVCLLILWFGVSSGGAAEPGPEGSPLINPFSEAEYYFNSGEIPKAQPLYQEYLAGNPRGERAARALFRLGTIDQQNRSFATALRYYHLLLQRSPEPLLVHDVKFNMAQCYFELEQFNEAEALFRQTASSHPDKKRRWEAKIQLGRMDERRLDYENAIDKLKRVYVQSEDKEARDLARQLIERIIEEKLSKSMLMGLSRKYPSGFPADRILLRMISLHRDERNLDLFQSTLQQFLRLFPEHPRRAEMEAGLRFIEGNRDRKLRLGVVLPLTGEMALTGQQVLQGIQLAVNASGLARKGKVEMVVKDSAARPVEQVVAELASDPGVVGIIGPVLSDYVKQVAPLADRYRIPVFSPTASSPGLPQLSPYVFRNASTREIQGKYIAQYAFNALHLRRFVVLFPLEEYGFELRDAFSREVKSLGGEVMAAVPYERSQTDFKQQILEIGGISDDRLKKLVQNQLETNTESPPLGQGDILSRPLVEMGLWSENAIENLKVSLELSYDAIFLPGFYDKVGLIVPQLVFYNVDKVTLLGAGGWNSPELVDIAGNYMREGYFVDGFYAQSNRPEVSRFVTEYKSTFAETPTLLSAQSYDAANMILQTLVSGAQNRLQVQDRLLHIRGFQGVSGRTTILPTGEADKRLFTLKIVKKKIVEDN